VCLALPGEIVDVGEGPLREGRVSFDGVVKGVSLVYVPEAGVGDHVLVHAGFAIAKVSEEHAREALAWAKKLAEAEGPGERGGGGEPG
jgi:hydrogenase expression/formation protein HypC